MEERAVPAGGATYIHSKLCLSAPSATGQGTWSTSVLNYILFRINSGTGTNLDNITYTVWLKAGTYAMDLVIAKNANRGILDVDVDGTEKGSVDCYAAAPANGILSITGITVATDKEVAIKFRVDGQNGSSSGYYVSFNAVVGRSG